MPAEILVDGYEADLTADLTTGAVPFDISVSTLNTPWGVTIPATGQFNILIGRMPAGSAVVPSEVEWMRVTREGAAAGKIRAIARALYGTTAIAHDADDTDVKIVAVESAAQRTSRLGQKLGYTSKAPNDTWRVNIQSGGSGNFTLTIDRGTAVAAMWAPGDRFDKIRTEVLTAVASSQIRLMVYEDAGWGYPGALLIDAGTVSSATTGNKDAVLGSTYETDVGGKVWYVAMPSHSGVALRGFTGIEGLFVSHPGSTDFNSIGCSFTTLFSGGFAGGAQDPFPNIDTMGATGPKIGMHTVT